MPQPVPLPTIAHVLHRLYLAGAEVLAADLARRLRGRFRFVFFCLDEVGPLGVQLAGEGFPTVDLVRRPGVDWALARRLRHACRIYHVDLLHAHQYTPFFYAALSRGLGSRPPLLFTEHGRHYPDFRRPKRVLANRLLLHRADRVTAVGQFVQQALVDHEGLAAGRIEVIHNGVDPACFPAPDAVARAAARAELDLPTDAPVLLQVARFHPVKDHATALRALGAVLKSWPPVPEAARPVLLLAGDGEDRTKIEALAVKLRLGRCVRFLGVRQDVPRLMAAADLFLLTSLSEGISVTLLEAMAAALPIVTTDVGGNSEVVVHGQTGLLAPRGDAEGLAQAMVTLLRDPMGRQTMGQAGRRRLLEQFTQQRMHDRYAQLYDQMLGSPIPRGDGTGTAAAAR
jgi:glycosyltransferase involved in cell wall biosynthesis